MTFILKNKLFIALAAILTICNFIHPKEYIGTGEEACLIKEKEQEEEKE